MTKKDLIQTPKDEIKVSVIMSLYNVEMYMRTALDSVINQTLKDIEIICINDGSEDYSLNCAKEYAERDSRIRIITYKETKGQAYARNRGIDIAKGKYIGFVDGDDWVEPFMFEKLYEEAESKQTDVTFCAAVLYDELMQECRFNNAYYSLSLIPSILDNRVFNASDTKELLTGRINVALWNKIYRTDFMNKYNIRFPEYYIYEDMPFFYEVWFKAKKISLIRDYLYFYRINRSGSTMSLAGKKVLDRVDMVSLTYEMYKKQTWFNEYKTEITGWIIDDLFHRYTLVEHKYKKEFFFKMKKLFINLDTEKTDSEKLSKVYCYKEYLNIIKMTYDEFNKTLFETYVNSKKKTNDLKSEMKEGMYRTQRFYDDLIVDIKSSYEKTIKEIRETLERTYEERLKIERDKLLKSISEKKSEDER